MWWCSNLTRWVTECMWAGWVPRSRCGVLGWDKNCLISKGEVDEESKQERKQNKWCKGNHSPPPTGRPRRSQFLSQRWLLQKPLLALFLAERDVWHGISLYWGICLVVSLPNLLCTPDLFTAGTEWGAEKVLTLCRHCSAIAVTVFYQRWFGHKSKTQHHTSCSEAN